ncbi:hypothetical protein EYC98_21505 [Halieaceae bacterium IMCC14734]|uniref:Intracellular septation protein A n=1 Tax=Candidatus Litorirhabdus singularis TaxID=2518993 RepID=A0ABT3TMD0_9GAMM|nr:hypothetical protein [Candidatus Litorirhabdus singularis]MCX2983445.1 hypothetical protein [Candidatus Litorirhabdus singularis]
MQQTTDRARELLPTVVITVLSMIQALALELYWTRFRESDYLWQSGWEAALGWVQLAVMLLGILQIWLFYVSLVLRFSWMPTMEDTLAPFIIGLLEFAMIDLMGSDDLGAWFLMLAAVFAVSIGASHLVFRRARRDPLNDYFFSNMAAATWRDYLSSLMVVALLIMVGSGLWLSGHAGAFALAGLLFALAALSYQLVLIHRYWLVMPPSATSLDNVNE